MQRLADMALVLLQWALVVVGLLTVLVARSVDGSYPFLLQYLALGADTAGADTYYVVLHFRWMLLGITSGLIAMGLGAALFYLRQSYLARRGP